MITIQYENNSTSTQNKLQMDEEKCRRLSFGVEPVYTKPTQDKSLKIHILEIILDVKLCVKCSQVKGKFFSLRKSQVIAQNVLCYVFRKFQITGHPYIESWFKTDKNSIVCFNHSID